MPRDLPEAAVHWRAALSLGFERRGVRTVLAERRHEGPLVVQKPLYPEGEETCHAIVVHPPGGIAGGDRLEITVHANEGARALLTTPGAAKWYRSSGSWARQEVVLSAARGAHLEWLPQETIVHSGALAGITWEARLEGDARLIAWDLSCLGRTGAGERFEAGRCVLATQVFRDGRLQWLERGRIDGGSPLLASPAGLAGWPLFGTFLACAPQIDPAWVAACREVQPEAGDFAVTAVPGVLVARYRGGADENGRAYFTALWKRLRPLMLARAAVEPRIWRT